MYNVSALNAANGRSFKLKRYELLWRPSKVSTITLAGIALLAGLLYGALLYFKTPVRRTDYKEKLIATQKTAEAFAAIKAARAALGIPFDPALDPSESGLIGAPESVITTKKGNLRAKQATANPEWAAVFMEMFREAKLHPGDKVAIGMSGSFPAMNISALVAAKTYGLTPLVISSLGSSSFGANFPQFTWLDMESILNREGLISARSLATSLGGHDDLGNGLTPQGRREMQTAISRNGVTVLSGQDKADMIRKRIQLFNSNAGPRGVRAYINIGGGIASVGSIRSKHAFRPGMNTGNQAEEEPPMDGGVMAYFQSEGVPVLHVIHIKELARKYGLDDSPKRPIVIGQSKVFQSTKYSRGFALFAILIIFSAVGIATFVQIKRTEAGAY